MNVETPILSPNILLCMGGKTTKENKDEIEQIQKEREENKHKEEQLKALETQRIYALKQQLKRQMVEIPCIIEM